MAAGDCSQRRIDTVRLKRAEPLDPETLANRMLADSGENVAPVAGFAEQQRLRDAMRALPVEQRRALFLSAYLGRTANEISALEGIPVGTTKTRIRTAMIRLRNELGVVDDR